MAGPNGASDSKTTSIIRTIFSRKGRGGREAGMGAAVALGDLGALGERISGALFLVAGNRGLSRRQRNGPYFRDAREIHMRRPTIREIAKAMGALNITAMGQNGSK